MQKWKRKEKRLQNGGHWLVQKGGEIRRGYRMEDERGGGDRMEDGKRSAEWRRERGVPNGGWKKGCRRG